MTIFSRELIRLPELIAGSFMRRTGRSIGGNLHDLSDKELQDIGLTEPLKRNLDAVKPFWMP